MIACDPRMCAHGLGYEFMHRGSAIDSNMSGGGGRVITFIVILPAIFWGAAKNTQLYSGRADG